MTGWAFLCFVYGLSFVVVSLESFVVLTTLVWGQSCDSKTLRAIRSRIERQLCKCEESALMCQCRSLPSVDINEKVRTNP